MNPSKLPIKLDVERVRLDSGGYDYRGKYWGIGPNLYRVYGENRDRFIDQMIRAPNAREARKRIAERFDLVPSFPRRARSSKAVLAQAKKAAEHAALAEKKQEEKQFARIISGKWSKGSASEAKRWQQLSREYEELAAAYEVSGDAYEIAGNMVKAERQRRRALKMRRDSQHFLNEARGSSR